ncbi:KamA family radical SAM protein [Heliorestis acidaminivorans]|uniref:KamA family radical SAM protein n=1 Tax=Heliorestis acidaminivorans TaxID=553427 RepID=A0A6I0EV69_9FIRM|nr:KamA family radical SAM protein [Heliorestis acidaminivorans]KAB2953364.1 KamA family radical SAM protein [Heliorestis acidaminivorans]
MGFEHPIPQWNLPESTLSEQVEKAVATFWEANPILLELLSKSRTLEEARERVYNYLHDFERKSLHSKIYLNPMERQVGRKALHVLKNIFAKRNEDVTQKSALKTLYKIAQKTNRPVSLAFIEEMSHLFTAMKGQTKLYGAVQQGEVASQDERLSQMARQALQSARKYPHGFETSVLQERAENRQRIIDYFGATEKDWQDWQWQCRNVIRDVETLSQLVDLTEDEQEAIVLAKEHQIPFGITPYYVSLMDFASHRRRDHAIRAQVLPPLEYVKEIIAGRQDPTKTFDFMGERDTSPEKLITRRYPMIAILKPYNTCAQICVYCQRNWEIDDVLSEKAQASRNKLDKALRWFREHPEVEEILITGGDPAVMNDHVFATILEEVSKLEHVRRIRIGSRMPVVLPMRFTEEFADLLAKYSIPGKREVAVMTHFEHSYETTPEAMLAIQRLRHRGIPVYNQGVYTMDNARRFEMVALRKRLRLMGVDPYYTFNAKGKEETKDYRVPIARLLQEQSEEARLNPGLDRSDEAVFNIPRLGKNYLRAGQDHEVIMIDEEGSRIYEFFPWDHSNLESEPFLHSDVPIFSFLQEMERRGELIEEYRSIWYYY